MLSCQDNVNAKDQNINIVNTDKNDEHNNLKEHGQIKSDIDAVNEVRESLQSEVNNLQTCQKDKESENLQLVKQNDFNKRTIKGLEAQVINIV